MKQTVASLLTQQAQCVLATKGNKELGLHLMAYDFSAELDHIYVVSLEHTQKVKNMRADSNVTLLWDNRTGNNTDHNMGLAMSGFGIARELKGQAAQSVSKSLKERNGTLGKLLAEDSAVIFCIDIDRYQWVEGYTRGLTYKPKNLQ
jgi:nitroimidazol reductase NimA-like FMN-containing flavoprotein (pyridoxamine 5'-phosphate oxidase superfamily)